MAYDDDEGKTEDPCEDSHKDIVTHRVFADGALFPNGSKFSWISRSNEKEDEEKGADEEEKLRPSESCSTWICPTEQAIKGGNERRDKEGHAQINARYA